MLLLRCVVASSSMALLLRLCRRRFGVFSHFGLLKGAYMIAGEGLELRQGRKRDAAAAVLAQQRS